MSLQNQILAYCISLLLLGVAGYAAIGKMLREIENYERLRLYAKHSEQYAMGLQLSVERLAYQRTGQQLRAEAEQYHRQLGESIVALKGQYALCEEISQVSSLIADHLQEADMLAKSFGEQGKQLYTQPIVREEQLLPEAKDWVRDMQAKQPEISLMLQEIDSLSQEAIGIEKDKLALLLSVFAILGLGMVGVAYLALHFKIAHPLLQVPRLIRDLGVLAEPADAPAHSAKEIADIYGEAAHIHRELSDVHQQIQAIGKGQQALAERPADVLGNAVYHLQQQVLLMKQQLEEKAWIAQGLSQIDASLLTDKEQHAAFECLRDIIKHIGANQGAIFLLKPNDRLELIAAYAYGKRKYVDKSILLGEGIIGQCAIERASIHIAHLPQGYTAITSGLGDATPTQLLAMPLIDKERLVGVIEMASFHTFTEVHKHFVEAAIAKLASYIGRSHVSAQLERSREEMNALEERFSQETQALQEMVDTLQGVNAEMSAAQYEIKLLEYRLSTLVNSLDDCIFAMNMQGMLIHYNAAFAKYAQDRGVKVALGMPVEQIMAGNLWEQWGHTVEEALQGRRLSQVKAVKLLPPHETGYWLLKGGPIYSPIGEQEGAAVVISNVSALHAIAP